jgi:lysozyme
MKASENVIEKIKEFEGCRLVAYEDAGGVPTIGYGHTRNVRMGDKVSQYYADEMLRQDIEEVEQQVNRLGAAKTQGQFDALVSFVFNLGILNLKKSTLLMVIRSYNRENGDQLFVKADRLRQEFLRWVHCGGKILPGLVNRRQWEYECFIGKYSQE